MTDNRSGSLDDSSEESGNETRTNSIAIKVNALIPQEEQEENDTQRISLVDLKTQQIALKLKVKGRLIKAILDTRSPVTIISRGVYDAMDSEFEEGANSVSSSIRKSKLTIFLSDQAVTTSGECDVKLEHDDFHCITPVIVAKGLAHECLIGMNVLVRWPAMIEAIRVLLKSQPKDESKDRSLSKNLMINIICLPMFIADFDLKNKILSQPLFVKGDGKVTTVGSDQNETSLEIVVPKNKESVEKDKDVDQEEFIA